MRQAEVAGPAEIDAGGRVEGHQVQHQRIARRRIRGNECVSDKRASVALYIYVQDASHPVTGKVAINAVPESGSLDQVFLKARFPRNARSRYTRVGATRREGQKGNSREDNCRQCASS